LAFTAKYSLKFIPIQWHFTIQLCQQNNLKKECLRN